jgi:hypothetical protein
MIFRRKKRQPRLIPSEAIYKKSNNINKTQQTLEVKNIFRR